MDVVPELHESLLQRYDRPGPRYTSYPTAPHFRDDFGIAELRHQTAVWRWSGSSPGVVQQHEREESSDFGLVDQGDELAREPDRLGHQVDAAAVALVEDQVQHA